MKNRNHNQLKRIRENNEHSPDINKKIIPNFGQNLKEKCMKGCRKESYSVKKGRKQNYWKKG